MKGIVEIKARRVNWLGRWWAVLAMVLFTIWALDGPGRYLHWRWLPWLLPLALWQGGLLWWGRRQGWPRRISWAFWAPWLVLLAGVLLYVFSGAVEHRWFYFRGWGPVPELAKWRAGLVRWVFLSFIFAPAFVCLGRKATGWVLGVLMVWSQAMSLLQLGGATGGAPLFRYDHPSFMFRLWEFASCFPQLVNYNPYWNGGTLHYVGVTSGIAGPGLLLWPLWHLFAVHEVYTWALGLLFAVLMPWLAVLAVRAAGGDRTAALIAGILSLGVSQYFFVWMLHFGTIGAALSSFMVLPVAALCLRITWFSRPGILIPVALILSGVFLLFWPPGALMGAGCILAWLLNWRQWTWKKWGIFIICALGVLILYSPWIKVLLREGQDVVGFVMAKNPKSQAAAAFAWNGTAVLDGLKKICDHVREAHPVLIFFGLLGIVVTTRPALRRSIGPVFLVLLLLAGWGWIWKPNSQLSRAGIPLFFAAVVPASILLGRFMRQTDYRLALARAMVFALLALGAFNCSRIYGNITYARYVTLSEEVKSLMAYLQAAVPANGRVLFAGRCLHAYGGGNVAYLPALAGCEMMADDYYGFPVGTIEYEYPPPPYRQSIESMQSFFEAYNVTHVLTYHEKWLRHFAQYPDYFIPVPVLSRHFSLFKINRTPAITIGGAAVVRAGFNKLSVHMTQPADELILKYNWLKGLAATPGVELFPYPYDEHIRLIGVRPHGQKNFEVHFKR